MFNNRTKATKTSLKRNTSYIGETIEKKLQRIVNNKEPIKDGAPLIYTERKDGVLPEYDIRTDRFEIATNAMDLQSRQHVAKRKGTAEISKTEPVQATDPKPTA